MELKTGVPFGTMIASRKTGMVLVRLRYYWVNLNNSAVWYDSDLHWDEWKLTHLPQAVPKQYGITVNGTQTVYENYEEAEIRAQYIFEEFGVIVGIEEVD